MKTLTEIWTKFVNILKTIWSHFELDLLKTLWKFILKYNEWFFSFPIGLLLLYHATKAYMSNGLDAYDIGVTQKLFIGFAFFFFILGMTRVVQKLQWPILSKLMDEDTNGKWDTLSYRDLVWLSAVLFCAVMLSLSILIASI